MSGSEPVPRWPALHNPLAFACANDFEHLGRVRDLEKNLRAAAEQARSEAKPAEREVLRAFLERLPGAQDSERKERLRDCLDLLGSGDGSDARVALPTRHPAWDLPPPAATLDASVQYIKGVGPKLGELLARRDIHTVRDLLFVLPRTYEVRVEGLRIADLRDGMSASVTGEVATVSDRRFRGRRRLEVLLQDGSGGLRLQWFHVPRGRFVERFAKGVRLRASGVVRRYRGTLNIAHPETRVLDGEGADEDVSDPLVVHYPEIEGIRSSHLQRIIRPLLPRLHDLPDPLPGELLAARHLPPLNLALAYLHAPPTPDDVPKALGASSPWQRRLIYEELLLLQLAVLSRKAQTRGTRGFKVDCLLRQGAAELLPFKLTDAQARVLGELEHDLASGQPMNRLLQGDVGSGKTAVALSLVYGLIKAGTQAAIMAPTEILAEQHARTALKLLTPKGLRPALLTGGMSAPERRDVLRGLASGNIDVVIGTHALIQDAVKFKRLGVAVVDEQHRFGVLQRARLLELGQESLGVVPHMLVMTATPIPRTLALTVYGDLDVALLDELPPGRRPIQTRVFRERERADVYAQVRSATAEGRQAYIVFPLVEESESEGMQALKAATVALDELSAGPLSGCRLDLLHGRLSSDDKDRAMRRFSRGETQVLVATTVVEVGIDVPNATLMVIENAERFGLSQLHQLRGRVGRGSAQSHCFLLAGHAVSHEAWDRLMVMARTSDGFRIAEEDLAHRGPGDFIGTRQSGLPGLMQADLGRDQQLLLEAREDAQRMLQSDPELAQDRHLGIREALENSWAKRVSLAQVG